MKNNYTLIPKRAIDPTIFKRIKSKKIGLSLLLLFIATIVNSQNTQINNIFTTGDSNIKTGGAPYSITDEWIRWDNGINSSSLGLTNGGTMYTASHWLSSDLVPYDGQLLSKVTFFAVGDPNAIYEIMVWTGPDAGTLVSSDIVTSFVVNNFNDIVLNNPVTIDASQELWFGYKVTHAPNFYPAGHDSGPAISGKGDMISLDGTTWVSMSNEYSLDYNWNIAGFLSSVFNDDLAITSILTPVSGVDLGNDEEVTINIHNPSLNAQSNFDVYYTLNGGAQVIEVISATIDAGTSFQYTFATTVDLSAYGTYSFEACVNLSGDENTSNDCLSKTVENLEPFLCVDGLYSYGCNYGIGLTSWDLSEINVPVIECANGDPYNWYHDYTDMIHSLYKGVDYFLTVKSGSLNTFIDVWIDYNDDLFFDEDEHIVNDFEFEVAYTYYEIPISIPTDAPNGQHALRYMTSQQYIIEGSCDTYDYGNMADFTAQINNQVYGNLNGIVTSSITGDPLEGASIVLAGTSYSAISAADGTYEINNILANNYSAECSIIEHVTETVSISILENQLITQDFQLGLEPPTNLDYSILDYYDVTVTWDTPGTTNEWIRWDDGINYSGIGLSASGTFYTASHWLPVDLAPYNGQTLTKITFFANGDPDATYEIMVWKGPNAETLVSTEIVTSFTVDDFNEITLSTPVYIDDSQELWFGYSITQITASNPAGHDVGPALAGKGDMISLDGITWVSMAIQYGLDYNWNIAGLVQSTDKTSPAKPLVKKIPATISSGSFVTSQKTSIPKKFIPSGSKDLLGYNVYRNSTFLDYTTTKSYFDENLIVGTYEYFVTAVYDDGESGHSDTLEVEVFDPSQADFAASITLISDSGTIHFSDLSSGGNISWEWDFNGDMIIDSYEQNPSWTYYDAGSYTVSLTVSDGITNSTEIKADYISVQEEPLLINVPGDIYTIQGAIDASFDTDTVLVQPGTYYENINFNEKNIVVASMILFTNDTSYISQTIIDGGNTGSVVFINNLDSSAMLSGFTITNGNINIGGGLYFINSDATLSYLKITSNSAYSMGAGAYIANSGSKISNLLVSGNTAPGTGSGGGLFISGGNPTIIDSQIIDNIGNAGGGCYISSSDGVKFENNKISNNYAVANGGGIYIYNCSPYITNNLISDNWSDDPTSGAGGIRCNYNASPTLINNTIVNNSGTNGGGLRVMNNSDPILINNILWGNTATVSGNQVRIDDDTSDPDFMFCDVEGGTAGFGMESGTLFTGMYNNCIGTNPLFADYLNYDYQISDGSPCINTGNPDTTGMDLPEFDMAGNVRVQGGNIDIGCYEFTLSGDILVLDIKAFLEGPFNGVEMFPLLNFFGQVPLSQPYNNAPWNYNGPESVVSIPNSNVVDWVMIELRDAPDAASALSATIIDKQSAFMLKDGSVVGIDGASNIQFNVTVSQQLFAVIYHRNHISIMSASQLIESGGVYTYDFTDDANKAYGSENGQTEIATGVWGMMASDADADGQINNIDKNDHWLLQDGSSGYLEGDFDMSGTVNTFDKDKWEPNSGKSTQIPE